MGQAFHSTSCRGCRLRAKQQRLGNEQFHATDLVCRRQRFSGASTRRPQPRLGRSAASQVILAGNLETIAFRNPDPAVVGVVGENGHAQSESSNHRLHQSCLRRNRRRQLSKAFHPTGEDGKRDTDVRRSQLHHRQHVRQGMQSRNQAEFHRDHRTARARNGRDHLRYENPVTDNYPRRLAFRNPDDGGRDAQRHAQRVGSLLHQIRPST